MPAATLNTLTVTDLSAVLKRAPKSIHNDLKRNPTSLPQPIRIPGARRILWLQTDVEAWLRQHQTEATPPKRRRGRPTKAEQLRRQAQQQA